MAFAFSSLHDIFFYALAILLENSLLMCVVYIDDLSSDHLPHQGVEGVDPS